MKKYILITMLTFSFLYLLYPVLAQDSISPLWNDTEGYLGSDNSTMNPGMVFKLYAMGKDETGLAYAWLSTNETGEWVNHTFSGYETIYEQDAEYYNYYENGYCQNPELGYDEDWETYGDTSNSNGGTCHFYEDFYIADPFSALNITFKYMGSGRNYFWLYVYNLNSEDYDLKYSVTDGTGCGGLFTCTDSIVISSDELSLYVNSSSNNTIKILVHIQEGRYMGFPKPSWQRGDMFYYETKILALADRTEKSFGFSKDAADNEFYGGGEFWIDPELAYDEDWETYAYANTEYAGGEIYEDWIVPSTSYPYFDLTYKYSAEGNANFQIYIWNNNLGDYELKVDKTGSSGIESLRIYANEYADYLYDDAGDWWMYTFTTGNANAENILYYYESKISYDEVNWTWSNFTWMNSSIPGSTAVDWKIYYNDTSGNENVTTTQSFLTQGAPKVEAPLFFDTIGNQPDSFDLTDMVVIKTNITDTEGADNIKEFKITITDPNNEIVVNKETAIKFSDTFTEADGPAANWNNQSAFWGIYNNQYRTKGSTSYNIRTFVKETKLPNQTDLTVETRAMVDSSGEDSQKIFFRYTDPNNYCAFYFTKYYSAVGIEERIGGTRYFVDTSEVFYFDQWYTMKVSVDGSTAIGYIDGVKMIEKTLTTEGSGLTGLGTHLGYIYFDNFTVGIATQDPITNGYTYTYNYTIPDDTNMRGTWTVDVYGEDNEGHEGSNSSTFEVADNTPLIRNVDSYDVDGNSETEFILGANITIRSNVTDKQGAGDISSVLISFSNPNGIYKLVNDTMTNIAEIEEGYIYEYNYTVPDEPLSIGFWTVVVFANDTDNNATTKSGTFDALYNWTVNMSVVEYLMFYDSSLVSNITQGKSIIVDDIDEDGTDEVILIGRSHHSTGTNQGMIRIYNATKGGTGWDLDLNLEDEYYWYTDNHTMAYSGNVTDIDDDGSKEIIVGAVAYNGTVNLGQIAIFNYTDNEIKMEAHYEWIYGIEATGVYGMTVDDLDEDGTDEIITIGKGNTTNIQLAIWNYTEGIIQKEDSNEWNLGSTSYSEGYKVNVADLDDDGTKELISAGIIHDGTRMNAFIRIFNYTDGLQLENSTYWYRMGTTEIFSMTVADVDDDGKLELLSSGNWKDNIRDNAEIRVWNYSNQILQLQGNISWYKSGHASAFTILTRDLDGDSLEIITAGFENDGTLDRGQIKVFGYNSTDNTLLEKLKHTWLADKAVKDGDFSDAAAFGDLNNDGAFELVTTGKYSVTPPTAAFVRVYKFISDSCIPQADVWNVYCADNCVKNVNVGIDGSINVIGDTGSLFFNATKVSAQKIHGEGTFKIIFKSPFNVGLSY